jgi:hypothetical protein
MTFTARFLRLGVFALAFWPLAAAAEGAIELEPYRVRVNIAFEDGPRFNAEFRRDLLRQVADGLERSVGEFWQAEVVEESGGTFAGSAALRRLTSEILVREPALAEVDKQYCLWVQSVGAGFHLEGREYDTATRNLGPLTAGSAADRSEIPLALLAALVRLFRPVATAEQPRTGPAVIRARGGSYSPPDSSWQPIQAEQIFEAYYSFRNQEQVVDRVQHVPWTYIVAGSSPKLGRSEATVISGLRSPLAARRNRVQTVALGVASRGSLSTLTLMTRPPARKRLAGLEVELSPVPHPQPNADKSEGDKPAAKNPRLVSDRNGVVPLSAEMAPDGRPVWLLVHSGQVLLARVPFLPGTQAAIVLELPDDSFRLETEGEIALVQAKLVDTVARRAVLISMAKSRAKAGEWDAVTGFLKDLEAMPKAGSFSSEINVIRLNSAKAARARRDPTSEQRIQKLCNETLELVTNYLDEEKLKELRDEINEMRQLKNDEAALEAGVKPETKPGAKKKKARPSPAAAPKAAPPPQHGF